MIIEFLRSLFKPFYPGDEVEWVSNGVQLWGTSKVVERIVWYEGRWWVFVKGSNTGIPANELRVCYGCG